MFKKLLVVSLVAVACFTVSVVGQVITVTVNTGPNCLDFLFLQFTFNGQPIAGMGYDYQNLVGLSVGPNAVGVQRFPLPKGAPVPNDVFFEYRAQPQPCGPPPLPGDSNEYTIRPLRFGKSYTLPSPTLGNNNEGPKAGDPPGDPVIQFKLVDNGVPTLSQWGLIALGVLLAGSLAFMIHRRLRMMRAET